MCLCRNEIYTFRTVSDYLIPFFIAWIQLETSFNPTIEKYEHQLQRHSCKVCDIFIIKSFQ